MSDSLPPVAAPPPPEDGPPRRVFTGDRLIVATHNPGKLTEIRALLVDRVPTCLSAGEMGLPEPDETGTTFIDNARLKALSAATLGGHPALADDSGFSLAALDGQPGIYSARWAGADKDFTLAMIKVWEALQASANPRDTRAWFTCALALAWPDGHCEVFEGVITGDAVWPPRGDKGFGYDAMFQPKDSRFTFGEIEPHQKHAVSHRARAFEQLVAACFPPPGLLT